MGILSRFGDIMRANINDLLTGAENKNAEKLLNQYLRDAREDYAQVKNETASVMAEDAAAKRRLDEVNDQIARYEKYAQAAVQSGNDADALKFLEAKGQLQPPGPAHVLRVASAVQGKAEGVAIAIAQDIFHVHSLPFHCLHSVLHLFWGDRPGLQFIRCCSGSGNRKQQKNRLE